MKRLPAVTSLAAPLAVAAVALAGCAGGAPGPRALGTASILESPSAGKEAEPPEEETAARLLDQVPLVLDPQAVMRLTVEFSPDIRRAFERKAAEEARYDFFMNSRRGLSYGVEVDFNYDRLHRDQESDLTKTLEPQFVVRKDFYNTTETSVRTGYALDDFQDGHEADAFIEGRISMPLFGSREALQRSNAKIFQATEVSDARLNYYREIRQRIFRALMQLSWAQRNKERLQYAREYLQDLKEMLRMAESITDRDTTADQLKLSAEIASTEADLSSDSSRYLVSLERLKLAIGIPFETPVDVADSRFNPFEGEGVDELCSIALETDEEIKTLQNSIKSSQAELSLARKGKWDTSLSLSVQRRFAGDGELDEQRSYVLSSGLQVRTIDPRISRDLENIALANIREYRNAIESRRREIWTETVDACSTLAAQSAEVELRSANLARYWESYNKALELYDSALVSIDELIEKREDIYEEQSQISWSRQHARENVTQLLASTGRYEQFINGSVRPGQQAQEGE